MKHYLSAFLMVKDENRYLREWVAFHRTQGFTKFFIYDNGSSIPVSSTLSKEVAEGLVNVTTWNDTQTGRHVRAMNHCLNRNDLDSTWLSLIDTDEFIYGVNSKFIDVLRANEDVDAVKVKWKGFGANGHDKIPHGLVIEEYQMCGDFEDLPGGKSTVKVGKIKAMRDPHNPKNNPSKRLLNSGAWINHYVTRSREDWMGKCKRGGGNGRPRETETFDRVQIKLNKYKDIGILKYLHETQLNLL
jgi:hypothetical protein